MSVRLHGVRYAYASGAPVVSAEDLEIGGGLTLVLGPNGAGKSTLLRLLAGVEQPDAGTIAIAGHDLWRSEVAARRALVYIPDHPDLSPYATAGEVVQLAGALRGRTPADVRDVMERSGLGALGGRTVRELSMGQRRRVLIAAALLAEPEVAILDEPLEAMDRGMRDTIVAWVRGLADAERTVILATHQLEPFTDFARRALVLRGGGALDLVDPLDADPLARREALGRYARGG
ncbi:MAG: ABC transporter ATP-binding protein [Gemmatimonadaceae bacterium]